MSRSSCPAVLRPLFAATLSAAALLLAGCAVGPDYRQPEVVAPAAVKHDQGWRALPGQPWQASGAWWQAFADETLDGLVEEANSASQTLAQAQARYRAAQAQRRFSRSGYSPVLGANLAASRAGGGDSTPRESASASLGIRWEPDVWGRVRRQVEADTASLEASAADLAAARLSLQLAVVDSYVRLRVLDQQRHILEQTLDAVERSVALTRNQYQAGIVSRADVIQAETQLQSLHSDLYDLQNRRALEENALAALLGRAPVDFSLAAAETPFVIPHIPRQVPALLIARRPDVVAAERRVAAANAEIGVASAAWLPDLSVSASRGIEAAGFSELWNAPLQVWSVGPSLAQTLFDGGRRRASRELATARHEEQVAAYRQTVLDSLRDVENALATTAILAEKAVQQERLVELAEANERVITNRYRSGLVSFLEVATAQNTTLNARRGLVDVTAERLVAAAELAAAIGGAWDAGVPVDQ